MVIDIRGKELKNNSLISLPEYFKKGWLGGTTLKKAYQNMKEYRMSSGVLRDMLDNGVISEENYLLAAEQVFLYGRAGRKIWIDCVQNYILFKMQHKEPEDASQMFIEMTDRIEDDDQLWVENNEEVDADKKLISYAENFDKEHIWMFDAGHNGRRDFRGNPKYLFVYISKYRPDICAYWYCEEDASEIIEKVRELGFWGVCQGSEAANYMLMHTGVIVSEQLRENIPMQLNKAKYLNLWHGIGFKRVERARIQDDDDLRVGIAKKYISNNTTYLNNQILVANSQIYEKEFLQDFGVNKEQILRTGYLRCIYQKKYEPISTYDHNIRIIKGLSDTVRLAVYAPTFRAKRGNAFSAGMKDLEKLYEVCEKNNILLIFKAHPHIEKEQGFINARKQYGDRKYFFFWNNVNDIYEIMSQIDLVIYDYSSMFSDFLCAGVKHFIRYIYDEEEYMREGFTQGKEAYYERTCGTICHSFEQLLDEISHYEENDDTAAIERMNHKLWAYAGDDDFEKTIQAVFDFTPYVNKYPTLYSYDVFDTLISRIGLHPYSIFYAVKERMEKSNEFKGDFVERYPQIRHSAEMNVREYYRKTTQIRQSEKVEIKFKEIFERLADVYGLTKKQQNLLMNWEVEEELNAVIPLMNTISEVKEHLHNNDFVVLISDMYLPKDIIRKMLIKADPELKNIPLFVSCEYGYQKASRLLFFEVYRSFKPYYKFGKWIHCGDTPETDKRPARRLGIETRLIERITFNGIEQDLIKTIDSYSAYLIAAMAARLRREMNNQLKKADFIIDVVAMTLVPYVDWVLRDAAQKGFEVLYFVARDGYPLKLIADAIIKENNWKIQTKYLYASRRTWRIPSYIDKVDDCFWISQGGSLNDIHSKEELFKALLIDDETFRKIVPQIDLEDFDWKQNQPGQKLAPILRSSSELNRYLLEVASKKRKITCEYLLQEFDETKKIACVEYWARGYNQECMTRLWSYATGEKKKSYFYYARSILSSEGSNIRYNMTDLDVNVAVMEAVFANMPYKSIEEYERKNGHVYPIIEPNELCDMSLYCAMNKILPIFAKKYAQLPIVNRTEFDRKLFDYSIEYLQNNASAPFIAENMGSLCYSMSMHGEVQEFARAYTQEDLVGFSNGIPRVKETQSIPMSYARSSENVKKQYNMMYQIEEGDNLAGSFVLKPSEIKRNDELKKKYEAVLNRATKACNYYTDACSKNHVYPKICIVSNSKNFDNDALKILNEKVREQQKLYVEWITASRDENMDAEMMNLLSMASVIIVDGNIQQLLKIKFRKETTCISLLDRGFRLYRFGKIENVRLKWQKRLDTLLNQKNGSAIEYTSKEQKELLGFTTDLELLDRLTGACVTDVLFDDVYKAEAFENLWSIVPEAKGKKIIFYMPQPRKRKNGGNWLELLDLEELAKCLSGEYFVLVDFRSNNTLASTCKNVVDILGFSRNISKDRISLRQAMVCADVIIGDYRDTFFESVLLHKPVYSTAVDMENMQSESLNMMYDLESIYPFPILNSADELVNALRKVNEYDYKKQNVFKQKYLCGCDGNSAERLVEYVIDKSKY